MSETIVSSDKDELRREKHRNYMRGYYRRNKVRFHELGRKKRLAEKMPKKCPICGETKVFAPKHRKYCSSECSKKVFNLAVRNYHKRWESKEFSTLVPKRPILLDLLQKFEQERQINLYSASPIKLTNQSFGRISRRKDGRYFLYLPKKLVEDTGFPFKIHSSVRVKVSFTKEKKLIIEDLSDTRYD
ncbi:MAG: hypothetical protein ABSB40_10920 [Nitrososphaeria archaeon]|jgi:hypothetical protein